MSQAEQLAAIAAQFKDLPAAKPITDAIEDFTKTFDPSKAVKVGDKLPAFTLSDATGKQVSSADLLAGDSDGQQQRFLLLTFYRGQWCPYCNVALQHLQRRLDDFRARGVTLVALTPELPDASLTTAEKNGLAFPVLTDRHNRVARSLGIVYDQSSARAVHQKIGVDVAASNGDDSYEMPVPATMLVDAEGVVRELYLEPDYRQRMDPEVALAWVDALRK
ncbi:hypothetical protein N3K66_007539 [Trichothecium roseum]|uniref:Uncharacterized protein n=1 Tax=Trichothecium roseum TaxID=47278 RepID=A0ACC0UUL5_9HYPO|nr:hypothetical protein N3K66_007539 [Trichothecium roseum]